MQPRRARPPAVRTTARPYTAGGRLLRGSLPCFSMIGFGVSAWLFLCPGVICNPQEHGSVIALDCKSSATCDSRADWICKLIITSHLRKDLSHGLLSFRGMVTQLGRAGARRALRGAPRSAHPKAPELIHSGIGTVEPESCRTPSSRYWPVLRHPCRRCINSALRRKTSAHC